MTFTTPFALVLLLLLPAIAYIGWPRLAFRRRRDAASLALRLLIVLLIVLGLAGLHITRAAEQLAVVFLVDVSDSMDAAAQSAALEYVQEAMAESTPQDATAVILFGGDALVERPMLSGTELGAIGSMPGTLNTDLAEAIRLGTALFPAEAAKRMVVLSDGVVTVGDAPAAARLAAASGVQIDFVPFSRQPAPEVAVTNVQVPSRLDVGEPFEINYTIESEIDTPALVTLQAGGQTIARVRVELERGENRYFFRLDAGFPTTGFSDIRVQVEPVDTGADGFYQNNRLSAFTEITGPARVLLVARAGAEGEAEIAYLRPALEEIGLALDVVTPADLPIGLAPLSAYASVIMVNVPAADLSPLRMEVLRSYVRDLGGGLVVIGGDNSYGVGGYYRTPLEDTLPVEMQIRDQERLPALTILFVIDTSGSMGATGPGGYSNLDLAKEAIIRSVDLLNPIDRVGVIGFDSNASWVVQPTPAENPGSIQAQVATLRTGGGTDILSGVRAAANYVPGDPSLLRHVILLTDGGANPSQIAETVQAMRIDHNTTTSVVAIGEGFAPFLQDVAVAGQGNFHLARDASSIPTIFTSETVLATRSYIVEEEFFPALVGENPILSGIVRVPPLRGYVASTAKDTAQVVMRSPEPNADPILAAWQFGLGRAVAWTSDATARWAQDWVDWADYPRFFSQMVRWTITEGLNSSLETRVEQRGEEAVLVVDARTPEGDFLNGLLLDAGIVSPALEPQTIQLFQAAPGRYEGVFQPGAEGAYFIRVAGSQLEGAGEASVAQTTGWVLTYSPEYRPAETGADLLMLNEIAGLTGGESLAGQDPAAAYAHNITASNAALPLWPWLLLFATLLLPFDVGVRRLIVTASDLRKLQAWVAARLGIQPPARDEERAGQLDRLMAARERARSEVAREAARTHEALPSAVETVLPADERRQPTPAQPVEERASGQIAASLAARKRASRTETPEAAPPLQPPAPAPRTEETPRARAKPEPRPLSKPEDEEAGSIAARLLKRRREQDEEE
ncbi:MAG: VWA domain-containing protein [Anaerolineae bacterium]|nr:VWA domain-containing protein [Anaerolineae bacterium]